MSGRTVTAAPLAALLEGLVDYAGLFPPASLAMDDAVARFSTYLGSAERAMLGRFVLPLERLGEFVNVASAHDAASIDSPWRLAVLAGPDDAATIARHNQSHGSRFVIDTIEAKAAGVETIWRLASAFDESFTVYVEIPVAEDPKVLIAELGARGLRAKLRTGGVTADSFPAPGHVLRFLAACARHGVAFKATAGLHHPLRGDYALTYAADAPSATMYGFLNLFVAAALLYDGVDEAELVPLLEERDASAFRVDDGAVHWRARSVTTAEIAQARDGFAASFGSCSFEEPVRDLEALNLLPSR